MTPCTIAAWLKRIERCQRLIEKFQQLDSRPSAHTRRLRECLAEYTSGLLAAVKAVRI